MKPTFSLLHASWGRPEKAIAAMRMALDRAIRPQDVEYIFAINADDPVHLTLWDLAHSEYMNWGRASRCVIGDFAGSAPAWDAAAKVSTGEILVQMQDDIELPEGWDYAIIERLTEVVEDPDKPAFIAVSDGFRKDALCCTAIMTRARYDQCGEFLHPGFRSVFSDDDVTYRALRDARDGKCAFVNARDIVFLHRHAYHDKSVAMDATYERENSSEAYRIGSELFAKRNPEAATDGLRTWT